MFEDRRNRENVVSSHSGFFCLVVYLFLVMTSRSDLEEFEEFFDGFDEELFGDEEDRAR